MEPSVIFGSLKLARSIAEFAGLIETLGTKIDRLANAEFEAGFRALEQAAISSSEKDSLLREARYRFNKAISLEKEERLFLCHVGIAICHKELGDYSNFKISLSEACQVTIDMSSLPSNLLLIIDFMGMYAQAMTGIDIFKPRIIRYITLRSKLAKLQEYLKSMKN